jgi:hypothetical protein|tara:strand:- start:8298 stop:9113 length:816 start_codon:yes stop_codon:yes gene_type:complete
MSNNKEVSEVKESNVVAFDASLILDDVGTASDNMTADDMLIPRIRILQSGSPQVKKSDGAYIKGAEEGCIFDNVTNKVYDGEVGITVVPVTYRKTYIEWSPDRKFINDHGLTPDNFNQCVKDDKGKLRTPDGNEMSLTAEYFAYIIEDGAYFPALISMSSSGLRKSQQWNSMLNRLQIPHPDPAMAKKGMTVNPASFWTAYQVKSTPETNDQGSWFNWSIEPIFDSKSGGILNPENVPNGKDLYMEARAFKNKVKSGEIKVKADTANDDVM